MQGGGGIHLTQIILASYMRDILHGAFFPMSFDQFLKEKNIAVFHDEKSGRI